MQMAFSVGSAPTLSNKDPRPAQKDPPCRQRACYIKTITVCTRSENKNSGRESQGA
jgi:hypothetical protein